VLWRGGNGNRTVSVLWRGGNGNGTVRFGCMLAAHLFDTRVVRYRLKRVADRALWAMLKVVPAANPTNAAAITVKLLL
jgi:hypothetical protein